MARARESPPCITEVKKGEKSNPKNKVFPAMGSCKREKVPPRDSIEEKTNNNQRGI